MRSARASRRRRALSVFLWPGGAPLIRTRRIFAAHRALPQGVLGPVLQPPWKRQRLPPGTTRALHGSPARLRAPQINECMVGPLIGTKIVQRFPKCKRRFLTFSPPKGRSAKTEGCSGRPKPNSRFHLNGWCGVLSFGLPNGRRILCGKIGKIGKIVLYIRIFSMLPPVSFFLSDLTGILWKSVDTPLYANHFTVFPHFEQ
jgi:hypothetical protein